MQLENIQPTIFEWPVYNQKRYGCTLKNLDTKFHPADDMFRTSALK